MKTKIIYITVVLSMSAASWAKPKDAQMPISQEPSIESQLIMTSPTEAEFYNKWHRRFTYITAGLAAAAVATHEEKQKAKESHEVLGTATAASFFAASYFAWAAPRDPNKIETRSQKYHRYLGYALVPLMVALPISGIDANSDYEDGRTEADGIGSKKGALTGLTLATLAASTLTLYFEF